MIIFRSGDTNETRPQPLKLIIFSVSVGRKRVTEWLQAFAFISTERERETETEDFDLSSKKRASTLRGKKKTKIKTKG